MSKYNQKPIASKKQIGILGIGAIGSVISSLLFQNKKLELYYFNRSKKEVTTVHFENTSTSINLTNTKSIATNNQLDWLIICLKEYHFAEAKDSFKKLISSKTKIVIIRNGIDLKAPILPYSPNHQILECMIDCSTQPKKDGSYLQLKKPIITSTSNDLATEFQNLFDIHNCSFKQVDDFKTATWKKLLESSAIGAITCLTGETCRIFKKKENRIWYQQLLEEGIKVAKTDGAIIPNDFVNVLLQKLNSYSIDKGSSMLTDRLLGRPIELGAKNGAIIKKAKQYNIETPKHKDVVKSINLLMPNNRDTI